MTDLLDRPVRELFQEASRDAGLDAAAQAVVPPASGHKPTRPGGRSGKSSPARKTTQAEDAAAEVFSAAFALLVREAVPVMQKLGLPLLAAALREERPGEAVAGLLADVAAESLISDDDDPLAQAMANSARRRRELLVEAGRGRSTAAVANALGTTRQAVDKRRRTGTLLAVPMPTGEWVFPMAQFQPDGRPLEGLADALRAFSIQDPWMRLAEMLAPDEDLGGRSVFQALREDGREALPTIRRALAGVGEHGG